MFDRGSAGARGTVPGPGAPLPRIRLGVGPTPLQEAPRLAAALGGPRLLVKRDDLLPLGMGGNKLRKLEYLLGHALAGGADAVVTAGAHTSNHARLTAAACARLGLEAHLVLRAPDGRPPLQGNLLLDHLFGARVHLAPAEPASAAVAAIGAVADDLRAAGRCAYAFPVGGSVGRGALGYVHAVEELLTQCAERGAQPTAVFTATGSGGTHAGLLLGRRVCAQGWRAVGVLVGGDEPDAFAAETLAILRAGEGLLGFGPAQPEAWGFAPPPPPLPTPAAGEARAALAAAGGELLAGYVGAGYGDITPGVREALALTARTEGLVLDPVYTGKAMAGLIGEIRAGRLGPRDTVVFLHTGGLPGLFSRAADVLQGAGAG